MDEAQKKKDLIVCEKELIKNRRTPQGMTVMDRGFEAEDVRRSSAYYCGILERDFNELLTMGSANFTRV